MIIAIIITILVLMIYAGYQLDQLTTSKQRPSPPSQERKFVHVVAIGDNQLRHHGVSRSRWYKPTHDFTPPREVLDSVITWDDLNKLLEQGIEVRIRLATEKELKKYDTALSTIKPMPRFSWHD